MAHNAKPLVGMTFRAVGITPAKAAG